MTSIELPYRYTARSYQCNLYNALAQGYKRAVAVWHRRAGKDKTLLNILIKEALKRVGTYFYFFPTYSQGKKILWSGMDRDGFPFLGHFPERLIKSKNSQEMRIELINGSVFQIIGTDLIDSIVGTNPVGCVFSEYSLQSPKAWEFIRPILAENGGFALFNYTPRGRNHGYKLYQMALNNPAWFCERLTVADTGAVSQEAIQAEREAGMSEDMIQQEFYCSFDAAVPGAYYAQELSRARAEGRITKIDIELGIPINTVWDLGVGDSTSIWFIQLVGSEARLVDYYECSGVGLQHYADMLQTKGYGYARHIAPHDIAVRELGTGQSRLETARSMGINFEIAPKMSIDDGIEAARKFLSKCWFDEDRCSRGLDCLASYTKDYDDKAETWRLKPVHNWASHGADAFRYAAVSLGGTNTLMFSSVKVA